MSVDPSNLLIFKLRSNQQTGSQTTPSSTFASQQNKPASQAPAQSQQPQVQAPQQQAQSQQPRMDERVLRYGKDQPPSPSRIQAADSVYNFPSPRNYYVPEKKISSQEEYSKNYKKFMEIKDKAQSREKAKRLYCAWHPWRHAYAICAFCHRPFCFEDTAEYENSYYCIEDIDSVEQKHVEQMESEYNSTSVVSALIMLGAFVIYLYFAGSQLLFIFNYIFQTGLINFILNVKFGYLFAIAGLIIMLVSMGLALYAIGASRKSHLLGAIVGLMAVTFFSYMYITTGTGYMGLMAILEFLAFMGSVYAAATGVKAYDHPTTASESPDMIFWPNVSKF